ncbi:MAG: carboxyl transferase domain-containing protein, partial [Myxococcales bacterium]
MMRRIESRVNVLSEDYQRFHAKNIERLSEFHRRQDDARFERPQRDHDRLAHHGKIFVRERIKLLLDPGTPFLEFSSLAANSEYDGDSKGASVVTGIGIVSGREVIIRADDPSIKGGAWYPLTVKKNVRCLDIAIENRLPVVHICDSAGGFLPLQSELFADQVSAGRIFRNQAILSKMGVPQLSLVFGQCTAGGAYIPALSDYAVILRGNGGIFLGGP